MDVFQLSPNHLWKAAPGCRILVMDNGGVRCDIPQEWIVYSPRRHVFVFDRFPPATRCLIAISCKRVPHEAMAIPLRDILDGWVAAEDRPVVERGEPVRFRRWPLEAAWIELRIASQEGGVKAARVCAARADGTQALIVCDSHLEEEPGIAKVWKILIDTLVVGDYIADPITGAKRMRRG